MAMTCAVCGKGLDAQTSVRCKSCRTLVCNRCQSDGVCTRCAAPASEVEAVAGPSRIGRLWHSARAMVPHLPWQWTLFAVLLLIAFFLIAFWPSLQARHYAAQMDAKLLREAREGAAGLVSMGTPSALRLLTETAIRGEEQARLVAIEALGDFPDPSALDVLRDLKNHRALPPRLRVAVDEAQVKQQTLRR